MTRGKQTRAGTRVTRRTVLMGMGLAALASCSPGGRSGRGPGLAEGSQRPSDSSSEGGIGGTGIVGILAEADGLLINGLRLVAPPDLALEHALGLKLHERPALGQALTVEALQEGPDRLVARSLAVVYPLIGSVEALTANGFRCLGVAVRLERGALLAAPDGGSFSLAPGQRVAVSGLWSGDSVVAARVDLLPSAEGPEVVAGTVKPAAGSAGVRIGAVDLLLPDGVAPPPLGSFATAAGRAGDSALVAERLAEGRFQGRAGPLERLSVEGYLEPVPADPGFTVSGLGHSFDPQARLSELSAGRALFVGTYDGNFRVELGLPLPEGLTPRKGLLAAIGDGFAPGGALSTR